MSKTLFVSIFPPVKDEKLNIYNVIKNRFKEKRLLLNNNFIFNLIIYSLTHFQFIPIIKKA